MRKIYLVIREAGEYSDWHIQIVRIFESKTLADRLARKLDEALRSKDPEQECEKLGYCLPKFDLQFFGNSISFYVQAENLDDRVLPEQWLTAEQDWIRELGRKEKD